MTLAKSSAPQSTSLHHPNRPFNGVVRDDHLEQDLRALANQYLKSVQADAGVSDEVLAVPRRQQDAQFRLAARRLGRRQADTNPTGWVRSGSHASCIDKTVDRSGVLLAGYRLNGIQPTGGEVGLRVIMHLSPLGNGPDWTVRITGMSSSRLPQGFAGAPAIDADEARLRKRLVNLVASLAYDAAAVDGMAYVDPAIDHRLRVFLSGAKAPPDGGATRNFRVVADLPDDDSPARLQAPVERITHATADAFTLDPASCPPPRRPKHAVPRARPPSSTRCACLPRIPARLQREVGGQPVLQVRQTRLGQVSGDPDKVQRIRPSDLPLRSDDLAAAHAYLRGDELMCRFEAYGLLPAQYFKRARLPLLLRHRAPLKGARDGISVNAQVRPVGVGPNMWQPDGGQPPPELEVSFGWAELAHRSRLPNRAKRWREQPMGLAADERWAWHEFGHVLNYASFGELEFRFAHSAGDALAAIVTDPDACRKGEPADRFRTFPWVSMARRHDRVADRGWCWCGRRNLARLSLTGSDTSLLPQLGYFEEQLLSSSLFRLYQCIGGEDADPETRRSASDYCVYLVMRPIQLLGSEPIVPAYKVDAFVDALIDADVGTQVWDVAATWPEAASPRPVHRVGGCVHKVIRWAFERQGLYAQVADDETFEVPATLRQWTFSLPIADTVHRAATSRCR